MRYGCSNCQNCAACGSEYEEMLGDLEKERDKFKKLAESFYEWTLICYPEETKEYQQDVKELKGVTNE